MKTLTFEFPTPALAADFAYYCEPPTVRTHRVVRVECSSADDETEARENAPMCDGHEVKP